MRTNEYDPEVIRRLEVLRQQPARDSAKEALGRQAFLEQAQAMASDRQARVSMPGKSRQIGWMEALQMVFTPRRWEFSRISTLATIMLIAALVFGSGVMTVAAAQNSSPDHALYPVKIWSEDLRMRLTTREQARLELALDLAGRRAAEIQTMLQAGQIPPEAVQTRFESQLQLALQIAGEQPEPQAVMTLARIQTQLQAHEQAFARLQIGDNSLAEASLQRTREMLQNQLKLCEAGLEDPASFRQQLHDQNQQQFQNTPAGQQHQDQENKGEANPGSGDGGAGPWKPGTPTSGSSDGPEPGDGDADVPVPGIGPGPGPETGDGSGSDSEIEPTAPVTGSGPGTGDGGGSGGEIEPPPDTGPYPGPGDGDGNSGGEADPPAPGSGDGSGAGPGGGRP